MNLSLSLCPPIYIYIYLFDVVLMLVITPIHLMWNLYFSCLDARQKSGTR